MDRFLICLPFTLAQECPFPNDWSNAKNFSNDKHDPGGETMCGIIQREYDLWRKGHSLPTQDVRKMSQDEGYEIYRISYWMPRCPVLAPGMDLQYFDAAVNMGSNEATKIFQVAMGLVGDGDWGDQTQAAAVLTTRDTARKISDFTLRREAVYKMLPGFKYFGTDWIRRASEMNAHSLSMVVQL